MNLHKGVDNKLQFQFLNQEQKPVDITGKEITCRIINYDGTEVLIKKALTLELPLTGIAYLQLNAAEIEDIPAQMCHYSLEIPVGQFGYPVFVDPAAGARGQLNVVDSVLPSFVPSETVTIPTGQPFPNLDTNNSINNVLSNANTYYSSVINTNDNPVLIDDLMAFRDECFSRYFEATNEYFEHTQNIKKSRSVEKLLAL